VPDIDECGTIDAGKPHHDRQTVTKTARHERSPRQREPMTHTATATPDPLASSEPEPVTSEVATADAAAEAAELRIIIGRLARILRQHNPGGLTQGQLSALATVEVAGRLRMSELAAREGVAAPTMTRIITALEELSLLVRVPDPADGRSSLVELTGAGEKQLEGLRAGRNALLARRVDALPAADRAALRAAVPALEQLLHSVPPTESSR
jgi:DNA-binding MarR family transcriptional regulator